MTDSERSRWIMENRCRAYDALHALNSHRKQATSEIDERMRKLKGFAETLFMKQADPTQQGELFDIKELLPKDLNDLLESPLRGLD